MRFRPHGRRGENNPSRIQRPLHEFGHDQPGNEEDQVGEKDHEKKHYQHRDENDDHISQSFGDLDAGDMTVDEKA